MAQELHPSTAAAAAARGYWTAPDSILPTWPVQWIEAALAEAGIDPLPDGIALERPTTRDHGDWSSNIALATAKKAGKNPRELGQALVDFLSARPPAHVTAVEIAGPGFVNFRLADTWLHEVMTEEGNNVTSVVWFLRMLTSGRIKAHADRFAPFIGDDFADVERFCQVEVEPVNVECDQVQIIALTRAEIKISRRRPTRGLISAAQALTEALGVAVAIEYLDASGAPSRVVFADGGEPSDVHQRMILQRMLLVMAVLVPPGHRRCGR